MAALDPRSVNAVVVRMQGMPDQMEQALSGELDVLAQMAARTMRQLAAKWRSQLTNSIHVERPEPLVREIRPATAYAEAVELGVKPGGKGLPRFSDPAAADMVAWLRTQAFKGQRPPRKNSLAAVRANLELRDRYEGLAWHIRHKGVKAQPFVEPTFRQIEPVAQARLQAAGERALAAAGGEA